MLQYVKAFTRNKLDLALVNFNILVTRNYYRDFKLCVLILLIA